MFLALIGVLAGCQSGSTAGKDASTVCGAPGQSCCQGFHCNGPTLGCRPGISFSPPGTCETCGVENNVCCPNPDGGRGTCGTGLSCYMTVDQGQFCTSASGSVQDAATGS